MTNYGKVTIDPGKGMFEYEVHFDPSQDNRGVRFKLLNQHRETLGPAKTFDGVNLYLPYQMPDQVQVCVVFLIFIISNTKFLLHMKKVTVWHSTPPVTNEAVAIKIHLRQKRCTAESVTFYSGLMNKIENFLGMVKMHRNHFNPNSPIFLPEEK